MTWAFIILITYCLFLVALGIGWNRAGRLRESDTMQWENSITVVIPVRNGASTILPLLQSIRDQTLQPREVIIVDDHSDDDLGGKLNESALSNIRLLLNEGSGKKQAITTGVKHSKSSIIVTTDVDCVAPAGWLKTMAAAFHSKDVSFAFGPVAIAGDDNFFAGLQAIEFASLIGSGAATAALGMPTMCNGANLAYRKTIFEAVGGYEGTFDVASGDDEHLMRKVMAINGKVLFVGDKQAIVRTHSIGGFLPLIFQRLRWASKWKVNSDWFSKTLAVYILSSQLTFVAAIAGAIVFTSAPLLAAVCAKVVLEGMFLYHVCRFLNVSWNIVAFVILQLTYPFYVTLIGGASLFYTPPWKGRKGRAPHPEFV